MFYKVCYAVYLVMSLVRGYDSDSGVDHYTAVKVIDYGGDKEFVVKGYVDASFNNDLDESESQSGYVLKVGAIS